MDWNLPTRPSRKRPRSTRANTTHDHDEGYGEIGPTVTATTAAISRDRLASRLVRTRLVALVATLLMASIGVVLGACGTTGAFAADSTCHSSSGVVCIGQSDSTRTVHVRLGETVEVTLSDTSLVWSDIRQVGPHLLRVTHNVTRSVLQLRETFEPIATGHTTLQATGAAHCTAGQACPQFLLLWRVQIVVAT